MGDPACAFRAVHVRVVVTDHRVLRGGEPFLGEPERCGIWFVRARLVGGYEGVEVAVEAVGFELVALPARDAVRQHAEAVIPGDPRQIRLDPGRRAERFRLAFQQGLGERGGIGRAVRVRVRVYPIQRGGEGSPDRLGFVIVEEVEERLVVLGEKALGDRSQHVPDRVREDVVVRPRDVEERPVEVEEDRTHTTTYGRERISVPGVCDPLSLPGNAQLPGRRTIAEMADEDHPVPEIAPENYYDDLGADEWERLERTTKATFEFENTVDYLDEHLPERGRVLDAGGASGRYAVWLAERGYDVTLLDLSGEQLRIAREKVAEHGVADRVEIERGDVRDLPYGTDVFDATLCLGGPLSHVLDDDEREHAVEELRRVTKPGGPVVASVMGFVAVVQNLIKVAGDFPQGVKQLPGLLDTQEYSADRVSEAGVEEPTFVECHFFRAHELETLLARHGLDVQVVAGLEGPASNFDGEIEEASEESREQIREVVRRVREDPTFADLSNHILAVARA